MTKKNPKDVASSVRQRLWNIANEKKEDFQLILTRYALERILFRWGNRSTKRHSSLKERFYF